MKENMKSMKNKNRKLKLISISILSLILILGAINFPIVSAADWLDGWDYRKEIEISQTAGAGAYYQIYFDLRYALGSDSGTVIYLNEHSQSDFDDIRFTRSDSATLLDYYFVNKIGGTSVDAYVKIDTDLDTGNATIYLYYGNSTVAGVSDSSTTFLDEWENVVLALPLNEGADSTAEDVSGFDNDGTLTGVDWVSGKYGNGSYFVATENDLITISDDDSLTFPEYFTWFAWVNCTKSSWGLNEEWATIFAKHNYDREYWFAVFSEKTLHARIDVGSFNDFSTGSIGSGWVSVALRSNGTYVDWFIDGDLDSSDAFVHSCPNDFTPLLIGLTGFNDYGMTGELDHLMMVNGSLSDSQISSFDSGYADPEIEEGKVFVKSTWLESDPAFDVGEEEEYMAPTPTPSPTPEDYASRGEILASAFIVLLISIPAILIVLSKRR